jgi:hypothetical protein
LTISPEALRYSVLLDPKTSLKNLGMSISLIYDLLGVTRIMNDYGRRVIGRNQRVGYRARRGRYSEQEQGRKEGSDGMGHSGAGGRFWRFRMRDIACSASSNRLERKRMLG